MPEEIGILLARNCLLIDMFASEHHDLSVTRSPMASMVTQFESALLVAVPY